MTDQLRPSDEDATGMDDQGEMPGTEPGEVRGDAAAGRSGDEVRGDGELIRSGVRGDRDAIAAAMPAADFDQRASEAQNDEKEADQEPEGDASLPPSLG